MADTIAEYNKRLDKFSKGLPAYVYSKAVAYAGATIRAQIENRVEQTQTNADGAKFSRYSTTPMLTSGNTVKSKRIWQQLASSKEKRKDLSWVTLKKGGKNIHLFELPGGYAELRRLEGFSNQNKSFEFTGVMWDNFNIVGAELFNNGFRVKMGGTDDHSQILIDKHSKDEGIAIIDMNDEEIKKLCRWCDIWVEEFANECGL